MASSVDIDHSTLVHKESHSWAASQQHPRGCARCPALLAAPAWRGRHGPAGRKQARGPRAWAASAPPPAQAGQGRSPGDPGDPGDPGAAGAECLHGVVDTDPLGLGTPEDSARGTTSFPMNLGQAAAFDPALVRGVAAAISDEARAKANVYRATTGTVRCAHRARRWARRSGRDVLTWQAHACAAGDARLRQA